MLRMLLVVGLLVGSTCSRVAMRVLRPDEKCEGIGEYWPLTIFVAKKAKLEASKGGLRAQSSYRMTPNDQISDLKL